MKKTAAILLPIWIIFSTWFYVCKVKKHCCGNCGDAQAQTLNVDEASISDGDKFSTKFNTDQLYFLQNGDSLIIDSGAGKALDEVANYLNQNDREITITGDFAQEEANLGADLGLSRAHALKNYFIAKGVDSNKVNISFAEKADLSMVDGRVLDPFQFQFTPHFNLDNFNEETMASVEKYLESNQNKYIYFANGSSQMDITPDIHEYLNNVTYFLKFKTDKSIECIGHTDNVGNEAANKTLGLDRARDVAKYLTGIGVKPEQIKTSSQGSASPIGDNNTEEGKAKNRRVEIKLL